MEKYRSGRGIRSGGGGVAVVSIFKHLAREGHMEKILFKKKKRLKKVN